MIHPEQQLTSINSQPSILSKLDGVITECWLTIQELVPEWDFETEKFDLRIPKIWLGWRIFKKKRLN